MNRLARERSPVPAAARPQPGRLVSVGRRGVREGARPRTSRSSCRSATRPATGATSWSTSRSRTRRSPRVLNEHFVSIKVDREERPDVDRVYMTFVQATTGSGGWPMSVWLTPELKPFYGGTYFPPTSRWGRPGLRRHPAGDRARLDAPSATRSMQSAEAMTDAAASDASRPAPAATVPGADGAGAHGRAVPARRSIARHGGFGDAPKFPRPERAAVPAARARAHRRRRRARHGAARRCARWRSAACAITSAAASTATRSTRDWRVPHFEKMLYDQAQLVLAYLEAAQVSGDPFYVDVAEDTLRYVMREMTDADGGFYSAEDADSVPPEQAGDAARRTRRKARSISGAPTSSTRCSATTPPIVKRRFGIEPDGNAPQDPQQEFTGKNLLYVARSIDDLAQRTGTTGRRDRRRSCSRARLTMFEARLGAAASAPRRQGADRVERPDDRRVRAHGARAARRSAPTDATPARPYLRRGAARRVVHPRADVERRDRHAAAPLSRRRRRDRRLRRRLRVPDLRPARAVSGRRRSGVARVGDRAAAPAGRAVLGRRRTAAGSARPATIRACCCG